jgi:hypothetical protein
MSKKENPKANQDNESNEEKPNGTGGGEDVIHSIAIDGLYQTWFLDYASYVILERAVPRLEDGFKPVQRRIMHSLKEMDDGRFNKVANVIGNTMQFHPHGDASIGDAIVNIGQKDLLIETQGNWGEDRRIFLLKRRVTGEIYVREMVQQHRVTLKLVFPSLHWMLFTTHRLLNGNFRMMVVSVNR